MKKFWKYFTLTILFLLGLGCVGVLYLFFVPSSTLFGLAYITHNSTIESESYTINELNEVEIVSRNYNVNIVPTEENSVSAKVYSNAFGFVPAKSENVKITSKVNLATNTLTFNISEPYGAMFKASSKIDLFIPSSKIIDLTITNRNAKTVKNLPCTLTG